MHDAVLNSFFARIVATIVRVVRQHLRDHELRMHLPTRQPKAVLAVPFPEQSIPDTTLAKMVEMLESADSEDLTIASVARTFDYPVSLVTRELARYKSRLRRYYDTLANS